MKHWQKESSEIQSGSALFLKLFPPPAKSRTDISDLTNGLNKRSNERSNERSIEGSNQVSNKTTSTKRKMDAAALPGQKKIQKTACQAQQDRVNQEICCQTEAEARVKASILCCQDERKLRSERRGARLICGGIAEEFGVAIQPGTVQDCDSKGKMSWQTKVLSNA